MEAMEKQGRVQCKAFHAHARYRLFQMAQVAVPRDLFVFIVEMIDVLRPRPLARC